MHLQPLHGALALVLREAHGVGINPGATRTAMRAQAYPSENPQNNPLPEEIMPVYLYLMGPDSTGVNGQAFNAQ
ncbi:NAD(P)-dependent dehydrogenase (short-subunit alcohol dehydrogenase family) [Pseudomonas sp. M5]|nr:NAD(P)-dependent dehydrogenase (short-subunit alcohol dehydrogenase family) [Pseudomonas sp. M5]